MQPDRHPSAETLARNLFRRDHPHRHWAAPGFPVESGEVALNEERWLYRQFALAQLSETSTSATRRAKWPFRREPTGLTAA